MFAEAYRRGHERIVRLVQGVDADAIVPACPQWTTTDVVRHLAGEARDLIDGNLDGFASDAWTLAQIEARSRMGLSDVIEEWRTTVDAASEVLDSIETAGFPSMIPSALGPLPPSAIPAMAIGDILHHEFDIRNVIGDRRERDLMEVHFSAAGHARALRGVFTARDLPTIRIESTDSGMAWDIGRDEPTAVLRAPSFELMRAIGGRRTRSEVRSMAWEGDADPVIASMVLPHLTMRVTSLNE